MVNLRLQGSMHCKTEKIIWFFDCKNDPESQFQELAKNINLAFCSNKKSDCYISYDIEKVINNVSEYLKRNDNWLLIFDNFLIESKFSGIKILEEPLTKEQNILLLSQVKEGLPNIINVGLFSTSEATQYLNKKLNDYPEEDIELLAKVMENYPLGLAKSSSFLANNQYFSVIDFKDMMEEDIETLDKISDSAIEQKTYNQSVVKYVKLYYPKLSQEAQQILIYSSLIDNYNLHKEILEKIWNSTGQTKASFLNALYEINKYGLVEFKKMDNHNTIENAEFELHDLLKISLHKYLGSEAISKNTDELLKKLNNWLPNDVSELGQLNNQYPTLLSNLERLLENAKKYKSDIKEIMHLKKHLLLLYFYRLDYRNAKVILDWFDKTLPEFNIIKNDEKLNNIIANVLLYRATYADFVTDDCLAAIEDFNKALNLIINNPDIHYDLIYTILSMLSQTEISIGELENAEKHIIAAEEIVNKYTNLPNLGLFYYVKSYIEISKGNDEKALSHANQAIKVEENLADDQFTAPSFLLKAEALNRMQQYKQAFEISNNIYIKSNQYFNEDHELQSRILTELARAELGLKNVEQADHHITQAINVMLEHIKNSDSKNSLEQSDELAAIYFVKGKIESYNNNLQKAMDWFKKTYSIYEHRYKNLKIDYISELYLNIAFVAYKQKDKYTLNQIINKHQTEFGLDHPRTKEMIKQFMNINDL
ncbi:hypothetical protein NF27_BR00040 [Candidatus Jidaibacter acanthamoeba]|uniref:MalT-like TPR region domain-containing protein n=2 Tax=Candidatus Jidaibacter acanthamoebae TaxID=86105 RepID=A0A0C1N138_9RICK|nr:hypothetical protein NF27_BR00040 [Candidatus Jidaibacter acanthamoeba]